MFFFVILPMHDNMTQVWNAYNSLVYAAHSNLHQAITACMICLNNQVWMPDYFMLF